MRRQRRRTSQALETCRGSCKGPGRKGEVKTDVEMHRPSQRLPNIINIKREVNLRMGSNKPGDRTPKKTRVRGIATEQPGRTPCPGQMASEAAPQAVSRRSPECIWRAKAKSVAGKPKTEPSRRKCSKDKVSKKVEIPRWSEHLKVQQPRSEKRMKLPTSHSGAGVAIASGGEGGTGRINAPAKSRRRRERKWQ